MLEGAALFHPIRYAAIELGLVALSCALALVSLGAHNSASARLSSLVCYC